MFFFILFYFITFFVLFILTFFDLFKKIKSKNFILLQNNNELRWGWWLITQTLEIHTFLWIPYKLKKHTFSELNSYSEKFFPPFYDLLSKKIVFRDINYSIFHTENLERFEKYYKNNFKSDIKIDNWILINFSLIEELFRFLPTLKLKWFKINSKTIFRNLSHLTTDSPDWLEKRKFIIFKLIWKIIISLIFIPFLIHIFFITLLRWKINKNLIILNKNYSDQLSENFIWVEENNLIWRKNNRFINTFIEYNFYIENIDNKNNIFWTWSIKIHKTLYADESFPISWKYTWIIRWVSSSNIIFKNTDYNKIILQNWETNYIHLNFNFNMKNNSSVNIINQSWIQNNTYSINFWSKSFKLLPNTNLKNNKEHWNNEIFVNYKKNIKIKYNINYDKSPLKLQSIRIMEDWKIQLNFQKEIIDIDKKNTFLEYKWKKIKITDIMNAKWDKTCLFIYFEKNKIDKYIFRKDQNAKIHLYSLKDSTWLTHYKQWRIIDISWKK